jgi:hypothetical protein
MKSKTAVLAVAALAAASLACTIGPNIGRLNTGPTQTVTVSEPLPTGVEVVDLEINMAAGELNLSGGGEGVVDGEIRYNVTEWAPEIDNTGDRLTITQGDDDNINGLPDNTVINDWTLRLGDMPFDLTVNAGAYDGSLDLDGVPLRSLTVHDGASNAEVEFNSLNPEVMDELRYDTGASSVTLIGLANANAEEVVFTSGAGDYELDFSGDLQRDLSVRVNSGVSSVRIVVPPGTNVQVTLDGGLTDVDLDGNWSQSGDTYSLSGSGPSITIEVDMGIGSLALIEK